jgi:hypothetical protein
MCTMVLVTTITFGPLRFEAQKQAMLNVGVPGVIAEDSARWLSLAAQGEGDSVTGDVPALLGRPACNFEQFATDYAQTFS